MRAHHYAIAACWVLLGQASLPALAALGGQVDSVQADGTHLKAQLRAGAQGAGYSVEQLQLPSGTVVSEYVAASGTVFAVSWHGPLMPNLSQILGTYFQQYVAAAKLAPHNGGTRRHFQIRQPDLVVQSNGRMRLYYGRAYVPSLLPANVTADDIQ